MRRHQGGETISTWVPATFDANAVSQIAAAACPKWPMVADATAIADSLNAAAADLLVTLKANRITPRDAEDWARELAAGCAVVNTSFRPAMHRAARRLGVEPDAVKAMLETLRQVAAAAAQHAQSASDAKGHATAERPPAENRWLEMMGKIYQQCFAREPGTTRYNGDRGGPFPRFVADVANRLMADSTIADVPPAWRLALQRMALPTRVARRFEECRLPRASPNQARGPGKPGSIPRLGDS